MNPFALSLLPCGRPPLVLGAGPSIKKSRFEAEAIGMKARHLAIPLFLLLSGCASTPGPGAVEMAYAPPSPPTETAIASAVAAIAGEASLVRPLEISAVRQNDRGPGAYFVCVREVNPPADKARRTYATFLDNDTYKGSRLAVILDQCELQAYVAAPVAAPAAPPPSTDVAKPAKHKSRSQPG